MTERKAKATATTKTTTKANTGILHYVQDDGGLEAMDWPRALGGDGSLAGTAYAVGVFGEDASFIAGGWGLDCF